MSREKGACSRGRGSVRRGWTWSRWGGMEGPTAWPVILSPDPHLGLRQASFSDH